MRYLKRVNEYFGSIASLNEIELDVSEFLKEMQDDLGPNFIVSKNWFPSNRHCLTMEVTEPWIQDEDPPKAIEYMGDYIFPRIHALGYDLMFLVGSAIPTIRPQDGQRMYITKVAIFDRMASMGNVEYGLTRCPSSLSEKKKWLGSWWNPYSEMKK